MTILFYLAGAFIGFLILIPFRAATTKTLAEYGYIAFACMLMIYFGAHLATSDLTRIIIEAVFSLTAMGAALIFRFRWPAGVGGLVLMHGFYDYLLGHEAGVTAWYPPMCSGFDLVVGSGLIYLISRRKGGVIA